MHREMLAGASETTRADRPVPSEPERGRRGTVSGNDLSALSIDELLGEILRVDREAASLHARSARSLAELNSRSSEMGAAHVAPNRRNDRRSERRSGRHVHSRDTDAAAREAAQREELGARLVVTELAVARRMSESTIRRELDEATRLVRLPAALAALDTGTISPAHARALTDGASEVPIDGLADFESLVLATAQTGTPAQTRRRSRAVRERLHPHSIDIRAARRRRERRLVFEPDRDGMAWLHLHLPCAEARGAFERIDAAARSLVAQADEHRGIGQIRADVAAELLLYGDTDPADGPDPAASDGSPGRRPTPPRGAARSASAEPVSPSGGPASPSRGRRPGPYARFHPTVRVTVPVLSLLGESEEPAVLEGYGPIPLGVAEQLAASAPSFTRILTHPETGAVLSVGRSSYAVPADLRRFVELRDVRCRFPGCERGAERCDVDHTTSWEHGGTTSHDNLACLCRSHHRLKHETSWRVERPPDAPDVLVWTSPLGRRTVDEPEPPF